MLNLNKELEQLEGLKEVLSSAINKTEIGLKNLDNKESIVVLGFMEELKEKMTNGEGIEELQEKIKTYASNRH